MSNQCPATCHSYTVEPEAGFTYIKLKEGESFVVERGDHNSLLFLLGGDFEVSSEERRDYVVRADHFVFCFRAYQYEIKALSDVEIIRAHFITAGATCDMIPFRSRRSTISSRRCLSTSLCSTCSTRYVSTCRTI